jgi:hypothetical protein
MKLHIARAAVVMAALPFSLSAQADLATITGTVSDQAHAVIADVIVTVRNVGTDKDSEAIDECAGIFHL